MLLIVWPLQSCVDHPVVKLIVVEELVLPVVGETIPEKTEHVSYDNGEQSHLEDMNNSQYISIIGNLVISVNTAIAFLHLVEQLLFWD